MKIHKQKGMSIVGFIIVLGLAIFVAFIGMRIAPMYLEYYSVVKTLESVAAEPGSARYGPYDLRLKIITRLQLSYTENVTESDIKVTRGNGVHVRIAYQVRQPVIGNLDVIATFDKSVRLSN